MEKIIRPEYLPLFSNVMSSLNQNEKLGLQIIEDILSSRDPKRISTIPAAVINKASTLLTQNFSVEEAEKFFNSKYLVSHYTENFGKKDTSGFTSVASISIQTKIRRLSSLELARILRRDAVMKISEITNSNLENYHFSLVLDALRSFYAIYKTQVSKSEFQYRFQNPDVFKA